MHYTQSCGGVLPLQKGRGQGEGLLGVVYPSVLLAHTSFTRWRDSERGKGSNRRVVPAMSAGIPISGLTPF